MSALGLDPKTTTVFKRPDGKDINVGDYDSKEIETMHSKGTITDDEYNRTLNPRAGDRKFDFAGLSGNLSSLLANGNLATAGADFGKIAGGIVGLFNKDAGSKVESSLAKAGRALNDPYAKKIFSQSVGTSVNILGNVANAALGFKDELSSEGGSFKRALGSAVGQGLQGGLDFLFNKKSTIGGFNQLIGAFR